MTRVDGILEEVSHRPFEISKGSSCPKKQDQLSKFLVTFDNWHSMGYGVDVMAYYNEKGELIKRHMLEDISPFPINTYVMSISSLWWRCGQEFIDNQRISICFMDENEVIEKRTYNLKEQRIEKDAP